MYGIYANIYHEYTPVLLAYIPYDWIRHGIGKLKEMAMERDRERER